MAWCDGAPADVVIGVEGEGELITCNAWPGLDGALALIEAGYARMKDHGDLERLHHVGRSLVSEQRLDKLLDLILVQARRLVKAEAGSIYLIVGDEGERELIFAHTQNARVAIPYHRFRMPISKNSMAGFVAETGEGLNIHDVYRIPPDAPYQFNDSFDRQARYRTVSMLVVPLLDAEGEVLGVLQLINRLDENENIDVFAPRHLRLAESLAGQAGVAVKNAKLREEIEHLFDSFVNAAVLAIEQRDPVTSGHSARVANMTVGLLEAVNATTSGPYADVHFSDRQIREIRYASLLHDFGKVGVREQVLVKAKKLEPTRLEIVLSRLRQRQEERLLEKVIGLWSAGTLFSSAFLEGVKQEMQAEADRLISVIVHANEPTVLTESVLEDLEQFRGFCYAHWNGQVDSVLSEEDMDALKIPKGSLSENERREIESHVKHSFDFLRQIPWTRDLAAVPEIAYAHHERANGLGYPRRLMAPDIPLQSRAMAIADVFDALTAQDRPYKAALPLGRSLAILESEAKAGNLDAELLRIFIESEVFRFSGWETDV